MSGVNTTQFQLRNAQTAHLVHPWPGTAGKPDELSQLLFEKYQDHRAYDDWNAPLLHILAYTSTFVASAIENDEAMRKEGMVVKTPKGAPMANPRVSVHKTLQSIISDNMNLLGIKRATTHRRNTAKVEGVRQRADAANKVRHANRGGRL